jgi:hypothetical protein
LSRTAHGLGICDLWVSGKGVTWFDLPQTFAKVRRSPRSGPLGAALAAMSADVLLTRNVGTGFVVTHEPGPDLHFLQ